VLDQALDAAERRRPPPQPHARRNGDRLGAASEPDRQHAAEAVAHLPGGDGVAGMAGQARIEDRPDGRMGAQPFGQQRRRLALGADAQVERPQSPQQKEGVERAEEGADALTENPDARPGGVIARRGDDAGNDIGMAIEIFRGGMHHEIAAAVQRPGQDRSGSGRVRADDGAGLMGAGGYGLDIGDRPQRVAGRLDPDQPGLAGNDGGADRVEVGHVDERDRMAVARQVAQPLPQAPVHQLRRHDVGGRERQEHRARCGHARTEHHRLAGVLQFGDQRLCLVDGNIVRASVDEAGAVA
jgi:hypothetical protein